MASCAVTAAISGLPVNCDAALGGIKIAYIAPYEDVESATAEADAESGLKYAKVTMKTGKKFKTYHFKKNSSSMESTLSKDDAIGLSYVQTALTLKFAKMDAQKQKEIAALALGEFAVIAQDANGVYWFLGMDNPVSATEGTGASGTAKEDGNSYSITLTDEANVFPYEMLKADVEAVVEEL